MTPMQLRQSTAPQPATPVTLAVGSNTVTVQVTAQDGTTQSYTVAVTRAAILRCDALGAGLEPEAA